MKKAVIVENKGCATCSIGAACLVDGPIPDFEIAGATACAYYPADHEPCHR